MRIIITEIIFMVLSSWQSHCESSPTVHLMNADSAPMWPPSDTTHKRIRIWTLIRTRNIVKALTFFCETIDFFVHLYTLCVISDYNSDISWWIFSECELTFTFGICYRPSVCLSSVTFVHSTQPVEIFGNISSPFGTLAIRWHPRKGLQR